MSQVQALIGQARQALATGRLDEAKSQCEQALTIDPECPPAKLMLSRIALNAGDRPRGEGLLREILTAHPNNLDALLGLTGLLSWDGDPNEATALCEQAIRLNPNLGVSHYHLGLCQVRQGRNADAVASFQRALQSDPNVATIHHHLGVAFQRSGQVQPAIASFRRALELDPNAVLTNAEFGQLLLSLADFQGAAACFRRVSELQPDTGRGEFFLGRALVEEQKLEEGANHLRRAIVLESNANEPYVLLARTLQQLGDFQGAEEVLNDLIARNPGQPSGHYLRITGRRLTEADRNMIDELLPIANSGKLESHDLTLARYALGKAYDDLGEYEKAMKEFEEANRLSQERLRSLGRVFDAAKLKHQVDYTIGTFTRDYLTKCRSLGVETDKPIFIVGMARSGTTLLEQMVSSHPEVAAAGEMGTWQALVNGPFQSLRGVPSKADIAGIARELLDKLDRSVPDRQHVTIKTPQNYMVLGPIQATFPNARILHCKRHPVDTCLSIYMTSFMAGPDFAHDRESMVIAYQEYQRVMAHWRKVLPADRFMEVDYEQLVTDPEPILREVIAFLGLEWDEACLHHERNEHAISTPSLWQARQPVFKKSVARWKRYEPWLGPLKKLLEPTEA